MCGKQRENHHVRTANKNCETWQTSHTWNGQEVIKV